VLARSPGLPTADVQSPRRQPVCQVGRHRPLAPLMPIGLRSDSTARIERWHVVGGLISDNRNHVYTNSERQLSLPCGRPKRSVSLAVLPSRAGMLYGPDRQSSVVRRTAIRRSWHPSFA
jgi:hypothetical protein